MSRDEPEDVPFQAKDRGIRRAASRGERVRCCSYAVGVEGAVKPEYSGPNVTGVVPALLGVRPARSCPSQPSGSHSQCSTNATIAKRAMKI